jgi:hypothetical protein
MTHDDPSLRALVAAYVQVQTPSPAAVDDAWCTLDARVRAGDVPTLDATPKPVFGLGLAVVVGVAVVAAAAALTLVDAPREALDEPMPVTLPRPTPDVADPPHVEAPPLPAAAAPTTMTTVPPAKPATSKRGPRRAPAPEIPSLAAELELLRATRAALRGGNPQRALDLAGTHRRRYPESTFAEERSATEVMALCVLGRVDAAKAKAAGFRRLYPGSSFEAGLLASCDTEAKASNIDH